jgi:hypothetical protein
MNAAAPVGASPANDAWNRSLSRNRKPSRGGRDRRLRAVGRETTGSRPSPPSQRVHRLARVRDERGDVHQRGDLLVRTSLADDRAAVRVPDEDHRLGLLVEDLPGGGGVGFCTTATSKPSLLRMS